MFLVVDCNNFFVSCERAFNPKLNYYPCAVLSNNDGCIVARSEEVKKMGVPMGAPLFEWRSILSKHQTKLFSPNFELYGDLSGRVMGLLEKEAEAIEIYSIDEAFLYSALNNNIEKLTLEALRLRKHILKCTGIPVSIGISSTKTRAKLANKIAKTQNTNGVFYLGKDQEYLLRNIAVSQIWGVGRKLTKKLSYYGIHNSQQLISMNDKWLQRTLTTPGLRTVLELRGVPCFKIKNSYKKKKSICYSRSFGTKVKDMYFIKEALADFCSRAAEKLRKQNSLAEALNIFLIASKNSNISSKSMNVKLETATAYTPTLIQAAHEALEQIYQKGDYKKVGITLSDFSDETRNQQHLFSEVSYTSKEQKLMHALDKVNAKFGKNSLQIAASGIKKNWHSRCSMRSPRYTTDWNELLSVG